MTSAAKRISIISVDTGEALRPAGWHRLLVEPRRPESIRSRKNAYWLAVGAVCVGAFMGQLDASIVTVALPTMQRTFQTSVGAVTWVGLSYLLVLVATVTAVGRFADMWGRKLALRVWIRRVRDRLSTLWPCSDPRCPRRLSRPAGSRSGHAASQ